MKKTIRLQWEVGCAKDGNALPGRFIPATVPGSVQLDMLRAGELPDYTVGTQFHAYDGLEDLYWTYRTRLPQGEHLFLVSGGIDYRYCVFTDSEVLYEYEGMQKPFSLDVSPYAGQALYIRIFPAPKANGQEGRAQANLCTKGAVSYGWDFHPRLIPLGIWNDCYIEMREAVHFEECRFDYALSEDYAFVDVRLHYRVRGGGARLHIAGLTAESERDSGILTVRIERPNLWFPTGYGEPYLYTATAEAVCDGKACDRIEKRLGFKRVRLVPTAYNWSFYHPPATQAYPPIYTEVNGVKVFAKGTNWVIPEIFYSEMTEEKYRCYVGLIHDANMNYVRCWGGCTANKEIFFDLCDEYGILVWQEFPLSCNCYADNPHYLQVLASEAEAMLTRVGGHACCALFVGGNELFMAWSGMTQQSKALRMLDALSLQHCPDIPFLPTAPLSGMRHGSYGYLYAGQEPHVYLRENVPTAFTEFGVPSLSSFKTIAGFMDEAEAGKRGGVWEAHHGCGVWDPEPESWSYLPQVREFMGGGTLEECCRHAQLWQAIVYKSIFEEARRHTDICAMALNWDFCDVWPTAANNSIVEYGGQPKPAYYAIRDALKPQVLALAFDSIYCSDTLSIRPCILADREYPAVTGATLTVRQGEREIVCALDVPADGALGAPIDIDIGAFDGGAIEVRLTCKNDELSNTYTFIKKGAQTA